ncbi:protease modulator HflC [bacterium]|nr:protease modulator HflC [bacterium]
MQAKLTAFLVLMIPVGILLYFSTYIVNEGSQVVITQFEKPVRFISQPGLYLRIPFLQTVHSLEKRILPWDGAPENMQTRDKKRIFVDCWARWQISEVELERFFTNVRTEQRGQKILDDIVDSAVRDVIATNNLIDLVRTSNEKLKYESDELERTVTQRDEVVTGRENIEKLILKAASKNLAEEYGMKLVDVHIKRVKYSDQVRNEVYSRMRSERLRIAELFQSEAEGDRNQIKGLTRKQLDSIEGTMKQRSAEIRGGADAEVIRMTADSYGRSPEFYEFLQRLEMYKAALNSDTNLILSTDSEMFGLFKRISPKPPATPAPTEPAEN